MAYSRELSENQIAVVNQRVGELLPNLLVGSAPVGTVEIGEELATYMLGYDSIKAQRPIHESAIDLGNHFHVIYVDGKPYFHAISGSDDEKDWEVLAVTNSELSYRVVEAVEWANQNVHQDVEAVLLSVPALYLEFLWIMDGENSIFYALSWQKGDTVFFDQRRFTEAELRKVLFSLDGPRGIITND